MRLGFRQRPVRPRVLWEEENSWPRSISKERSHSAGAQPDASTNRGGCVSIRGPARPEKPGVFSRVPGQGMPSPPPPGLQMSTACHSKDPGHRHQDRKESHEPGSLSSSLNFLGLRRQADGGWGHLLTPPHLLQPTGWGGYPHRAGRPKPAHSSEVHTQPAAYVYSSIIHSFTHSPV